MRSPFGIIYQHVVDHVVIGAQNLEVENEIMRIQVILQWEKFIEKFQDSSLKIAVKLEEHSTLESHNRVLSYKFEFFQASEFFVEKKQRTRVSRVYKYISDTIKSVSTLFLSCTHSSRKLENFVLSLSRISSTASFRPGAGRLSHSL